jgi:hypothetical protein
MEDEGKKLFWMLGFPFQEKRTYLWDKELQVIPERACEIWVNS